jgi:hypothetical protein
MYFFSQFHLGESQKMREEVLELKGKMLKDLQTQLEDAGDPNKTAKKCINIVINTISAIGNNEFTSKIVDKLLSQ